MVEVEVEVGWTRRRRVGRRQRRRLRKGKRRSKGRRRRGLRSKKMKRRRARRTGRRKRGREGRRKRKKEEEESMIIGCLDKCSDSLAATVTTWLFMTHVSMGAANKSEIRGSTA